MDIIVKVACGLIREYRVIFFLFSSLHMLNPTSFLS